MNRMRIPTMILGKPEQAREGEELAAFIIRGDNKESYEVLAIICSFDEGVLLYGWMLHSRMNLAFSTDGFTVADLDDNSIRSFKWRPQVVPLVESLVPECDTADVESIIEGVVDGIEFDIESKRTVVAHYERELEALRVVYGSKSLRFHLQLADLPFDLSQTHQDLVSQLRGELTDLCENLNLVNKVKETPNQIWCNFDDIPSEHRSDQAAFGASFVIPDEM